MTALKVLVACEYSGVVRDAFRRRGHHAWSCDLLPGEGEFSRYHRQNDALEEIRGEHWDLLIAHPPCTYLCNSGVRWLHTRPERWEQMREGAGFFRQILESDVDHIAVENPVMHKYAKELIGADFEFTQSVQPWQFGHGEIKRTCLSLKGLPKLQPTNIVDGRAPKVHHASPGPDRWKVRSRTYEGIGEAMADQWGRFVVEAKRSIPKTAHAPIWSEFYE